MNIQAFIKFQDIMHDGQMKPISVKCDGCIEGCPKHGNAPCLFMQFPTTSITDMVAYVSRKRYQACEIPIDTVMDNLRGY